MVHADVELEITVRYLFIKEGIYLHWRGLFMFENYSSDIADLFSYFFLFFIFVAFLWSKQKLQNKS